MTRFLALLTGAAVLLSPACDKGSGDGLTSGSTAAPPVTVTGGTETQVETDTQGETLTVTVTTLQATTEPRPPVAALPHGAILLPPSTTLSATGLRATLGCREGREFARLRWTPSSTPGQSQRIAVTILPGVADPRKFELVRALPPDASSLTWVGVHGQSVHTWVVLTEQAGGWAPSERKSFVGPECPADMSSP